MVAAKVILDSVSPSGYRLTTLEVKMHRFVLAEFNTHRAFSRNSASSRAIPLKKQIQRVMEDPAIPVVWPSEQKGMSGGESIGDSGSWAAQLQWLKARDQAVINAEHLGDLGVHKSVANRLLEPFMWQTVICTATDWAGFWEQRCSPLAQPEIKAAADAMKEAYDASTPVQMGDGDWHCPYIQQDEIGYHSWDTMKQISAARCARVSYLTHDGTRSIIKDLELYDRLVGAKPPHWSPLEHVATPDDTWGQGNFRGWTQLRHIVEKQQTLEQVRA